MRLGRLRRGGCLLGERRWVSAVKYHISLESFRFNVKSIRTTCVAKVELPKISIEIPKEGRSLLLTQGLVIYIRPKLLR